MIITEVWMNLWITILVSFRLMYGINDLFKSCYLNWYFETVNANVDIFWDVQNKKKSLELLNVVAIYGRKRLPKLGILVKITGERSTTLGLCLQKSYTIISPFNLLPPHVLSYNQQQHLTFIYILLLLPLSLRYILVLLLTYLYAFHL